MIRETAASGRKSAGRRSITFIADQLREAARAARPRQHRRAQLGAGTNEENYVAQKFARVVLGTNNIDCCARVCHSPTAAAMKMTLGTGAATNSLDDIELARTILVAGVNPTEGHPVTGSRIKQAARRGAKLIIVDPRRIELSDFADVQLQLHAGTNVVLFNAMGADLRGGLVDEEFIRTRLDGVQGILRVREASPPEKVEKICGVPRRRSARPRGFTRRTSRRSPSTASGMTEHIQGTEGIMALVNLALLTGNIGKPGTGINPLRGQNNVQGAAHMGSEPKLLPGYVPLTEERDAFENAWHVTLPTNPGINMMEMMDAADRREAQGAVVDRLRHRDDQPEHALHAPGDGEARPRHRAGHLHQPRPRRNSATCFCRPRVVREGRHVHERRAPHPARARGGAARGEARPTGRSSATSPSSWARASTSPGGPPKKSGTKSARSGRRRRHVVRADGRGRPPVAVPRRGSSRHADPAHAEFARCPRGTAAQWITVPTRSGHAGYPFLLITGRTLYQFNAGTMTGRTRNNELRPGDVLDVSPDDAAGAGVHDGDRDGVVSRYGAAVLPIRVYAEVAPGQLFATFQTPRLLLNRVTGPDRGARAPAHRHTRSPPSAST